jgi:putative hydrolase of the HAD superfamily
MAERVRAIFFDVAGTLVVTRERIGQSYARLAREYGLEADSKAVGAAFRRAFNAAPGLAFGPGHDARELRRLEREWWRRVVADTFAEFGPFRDFEGYFAALFDFLGDPTNWKNDPDAEPLLARLKERGYMLGVISNFDYRVYGILNGLGLGGYFDSVTISAEAGWAKPAREIFGAALARHALAPDEAVHVGDSEHMDFAGALGAGIAAVLIDRRAPQPCSISGRGARVASLSAVIEVVGKIAFT